MKKLVISLFFLVSGALVFGQKALTLDEAIKQTAKELVENHRLEQDQKVAVVRIDSNSKKLSTHVIDTLSREILNSEKFTVVDRSEQTRLLRNTEIRIQEDGMLQDRAKVGKELSVQVLLYGRIEPRSADADYQMIINAASIESSGLLAQISTIIKKKDIIPYLPKDNSWKTKTAYFGIRGGGTAQIFDLGRAAGIYTGGTVENNPNVSFNAAGEFAYQFKPNAQATAAAQIQLELVFTMGRMEWQNGDDWQDINFTTIQIPFLVKPTFYPGNWYLSPFVGGYLNMSWGNYEFFEKGSNIKGKGDVSFDAMGGAVAGADIGVKAGAGIIFVDMRYLIDIGRTRPNTISGGSMIYGKKKGDTLYTQQMLMASVGYKFGLGGRK